MEPRSGKLERGAEIGGYRIDELIGHGGMGMVYRATNVALNRIYALKVLSPALAEDDQFRQRFKQEMRIAASLHHPNMVGIHYAGDQDGLLFLAMDYVHGSDLRALLKRDGAMAPDRAVDLLSQVASALDAAHHKGLVHRDVKPANILITVRDGEEHAYLTDFGLAKRFDAMSGLTATGAVVGTVDYMAPEQIIGGRTDARTDIYALGCVFFQMLIGCVPYERENSVATLFAHVNDPPPPLTQAVAESHPLFGAVIGRAMAKRPDDRYLSAGDFARDARAALSGLRYTGMQATVATGDARPVPEGDTTDARIPIPFNPPAEHPQPVSYLTDPPAQPNQPATQLSPGDESQAAPTVPPAAPWAPPQGAATWQGGAPGQGAPGQGGVPWQGAPQGQGAGPGQGWGPPPGQGGGPGQGWGPPPGGGGGGGGGFKKYRWPAFGLGLLAAVAAAVIVVLSSGSSSPTKPVERFASAADPVPTNKVTGSGSATVQLQGDTVTVTLTTTGLLNGSPHLMHIHANGEGKCPPASAARLHKGHLSISTGNGIHFYGPTEASLTVFGSTSGVSPNNIDLNRYPATGDIHYTRSFAVSKQVAGFIHAGNAVIVVHGIDYNDNHIYDFGALGVSDLDKTLTGESTAPALCGRLVPTQTADVNGLRSPSTFTVALRPDTAAVHRSAAGTLFASVDGTGADGLLFLCHLGELGEPATAPKPVASAATTAT